MAANILNLGPPTFCSGHLHFFIKSFSFFDFFLDHFCTTFLRPSFFIGFSMLFRAAWISYFRAGSQLFQNSLPTFFKNGHQLFEKIAIKFRLFWTIFEQQIWLLFEQHVIFIFWQQFSFIFWQHFSFNFGQHVPVRRPKPWVQKKVHTHPTATWREIHLQKENSKFRQVIKIN